MWCVADLNEDYIAKMEDVLEVYERPYDPQQPVVCLVFVRYSIDPLIVARRLSCRPREEPIRRHLAPFLTAIDSRTICVSWRTGGPLRLARDGVRRCTRHRLTRLLGHMG